MISISAFKDKHVAVFGLGLSGISAAKALMAGGAHVAAYDDREEGRAAAVQKGIPLVDLREADWSRFAALILAPGVPLTHPEPHWTVEKAKEAGVEIIGDTELFFRAHREAGSKAKIVAITGTNGKSTTTALIAHCLTHAGRKAELGGNIGRAVLDLAPFQDDRIYVIEFSSFQIDLTPSLKPSVAILLNVTPDHLDRHGTLEHYAAVKERIFANLGGDGLAVIGIDDTPSAQIAARLTGGYTVCRISADDTLGEGVWFASATLEERRAGEAPHPLSLEGMGTLRGAHNAQNAAAAYAAAKFLGLSRNEIEQGFASFPGLPHRMEIVGGADHVLFVNDSKATNADAAAKALGSYETIFWIAGGRAKEGGIKGLERFYPHIAKAYLIGESAEDFAQTLNGALAFEQCGTLEKAVAAAARDAASYQGSEAVVLLSPAAASYDQFTDFTRRGEAFREAVAALDGVTMKKQDVA